MKQFTPYLLAACIAAPMTFTTSLRAQDAEGSARVGDHEVKARVNLPGDNANASAAETTSNLPGAPSDGNKASHLIGMEVRNAQHEDLGEIQDLVVDLQTGRITYAVLSVGGFLGIGEKYIAVPPSAFSYSPTDKKLILNADKPKLTAAAGFPKTNWPDVQNPNWSVNWGASASATTGPEDWNRQVRANQRDINGTAQINTDHANSTAENRTELQKFHGKVTGLDREGRTVTVQGAGGTRMFIVDRKAKLAFGDQPLPSVADLKLGQTVTIDFQPQRNGMGLATKVSVDRNDNESPQNRP